MILFGQQSTQAGQFPYSLQLGKSLTKTKSHTTTKIKHQQQ